MHRYTCVGMTRMEAHSHNSLYCLEYAHANYNNALSRMHEFA